MTEPNADVARLADLARAVADQCSPFVPSYPLIDLSVAHGFAEYDMTGATPEEVELMRVIKLISSSWAPYPTSNANTALVSPDAWEALCQALESYYQEETP